MIEHSVEGGTKAERQLMHDAFYFSLDYLMPRKKNLDIEIVLCSLEGDTDGYHLLLEKGHHEIQIQKGMDKEDMLTALFHEMVHVRQYERGYLKDDGLVKTWKGEEYIYLYNTVEQYKSFPWEEEAYRLQEEIVTKWIQM